MEGAYDSSISVRKIVSLYETKTVLSQPTRLQPSKSFSRSHTDLKKTFRVDENADNDFAHQDLIDIERHLNEIARELQKYEFYSKELHAYFQTELVSILSEIVNIEGKDKGIPEKKKELILVVRNCNTILTNKLPGDVSQPRKHKKYTRSKTEPMVFRKTEVGYEVVVNDTSAKNTPKNEVDDEIKKIPASVKKLKHLFEQRSLENEHHGGLNFIAQIEKDSNLKRAKSFGGMSCDYVLYKDRKSHISDTEDEHKYTVEGENLKNDRVIHNTNLRRLHSRKSEDSTTVGSVIAETTHLTEEAVDDTPPNEDDSEFLRVFERVSKIERSLSRSSNAGLDINAINEDIERKFNETFEEIVDDIDEDNTRTVEQVVMLCEPLQRTVSQEENDKEDACQVSVRQLVRQMENSESTPRVKLLKRTVSDASPNSLDSNTSDNSSTSTDTIVDINEKVVLHSPTEVEFSHHNGGNHVTEGSFENGHVTTPTKQNNPFLEMTEHVHRQNSQTSNGHIEPERNLDHS